MRLTKALIIAPTHVLINATQTTKPNEDASSYILDLSMNMINSESTKRKNVMNRTQSIIPVPTHMHSNCT